MRSEIRNSKLEIRKAKAAGAVWVAAWMALLVGTGVVRGEAPGAKLIGIGEGWARSSVNTVIFRHSPMVTFGDTQYAAYYDNEGKVVLAKRKTSEETWEIKNTGLAGNATDAHNTITLG